MIPKKIHYCWFGNNPLPKKTVACIESWKKFCPEYEIKQWNESNFDVSLFNFTKEAYENKKYAFVSDVARLWIVYNEGGIYVDTDVEIIKSIDDLLTNEAFFGFEDNTYIATGLAFGGEKGNTIVKENLDAYKNTNFIFEDGSFNTKACPKYTTEILKKHGLIQDGSEQIIDGVHIFPKEAFNPYNYLTGKLNITDSTYSIHWFDMSWISKNKKLRTRIARPLHILRDKVK